MLSFNQMQDQRMLPPDEAAAVPKPRKKKTTTQKPSKTQGGAVKRLQQLMQPVSTQTIKKAPKRALKNEAMPSFQQPEKSTLDTLADSSTSGDEYRVLRRKYLLLEEESFGLGRELNEVEEEVKNLEEEKLDLLDKLVVLEGLVDPSEIQSHGQLS